MLDRDEAHVCKTRMSSPEALARLERNEAHAFDSLAQRVTQESLSTSEFTFSRYRSALAGKPIYSGHPDRMFQRMGELIAPHGHEEKPLAGVRILDLGGGDGAWSVILAEQGADVISIEISPGQVELARKRMALLGISWDARIGSAFRLEEEVRAESFDLVFGQAILHHLTSDLPRVYVGCCHALRPGGWALFSEPVSASPGIRILRERLDWLVPVNRESPDERPLRPLEIALLKEFFSSVEITYFDILEKLGRRLRRRAEFHRLLSTIDDCLVAVPGLQRFATQVWVLARK